MTENPETTSSTPFEGMVQASIDNVESTMNRFLLAANVEAAYGEPVTQGENLIIPAAEVLSFAGFGVGYGGSNEPKDQAGGGGGGGGGRVFTRPVAVIVASNTEVKIKPVIDVTKIALAWFTMIGFVFTMLSRMRRGRINQ